MDFYKKREIRTAFAELYCIRGTTTAFGDYCCFPGITAFGYYYCFRGTSTAYGELLLPGRAKRPGNFSSQFVFHDAINALIKLLLDGRLVSVGEVHMRHCSKSI